MNWFDIALNVVYWLALLLYCLSEKNFETCRQKGFEQGFDAAFDLIKKK